VASVLFIKYSRHASRLPPGPKSLPLIGNLLDVPKKDHWLRYLEWSRQYGSDVLHLKVLGTNIIIVNSTQAAKALFGQKSAIYSDRPRMTMISELIGLSWHFGFMPHGDSWREHRKMFGQEYSASVANRYETQELKWISTFHRNLLATPENFLVHIQHMTSGVALETAFGLQVQPSGEPDPFIHAAKQAVEAMAEAGLYGSYLVDYLPFLKHIPAWFPFAGFKSEAAKWRISTDIAATVPFSVAKTVIESGEAKPSFTTKLLVEEDPTDETIVRQTGAAMFASGSAAAVSAIGTFFLAMTLYPEVQVKAQQEIDKVVQGRLPQLSDERSLPFITAIVNEVSRWKPVVPLGFPHKLTTDDSYNGYHLPAGSVVIPNAWAILHDPAIYGSDPSNFNPERFLDSEGNLNSLYPDAAFGFGRRSCPGKKMATSFMFLSVARTLAAFDISKIQDDQGREIIPSVEYTQGMLNYPKPFQCSIKPRSPEWAALLASE